jgi:hypothetical protein
MAKAPFIRRLVYFHDPHRSCSVKTLRGELRNADETWKHRRNVMGKVKNAVQDQLSKSF